MFRFKIILPISYVCIRTGIAQVHTSTQTLAGHSKWANIKHIKGLKDAQKSALFARLARAIRLAVQDGGGSTNPDLNNHLRGAIDEALKKNMPNQTIQGVLKKCAGQSSKLKRYTLEIRHGQKVFMIIVLYAESMAASKMNIAAWIRKSGSLYADTAHMFFDKGIIEVVGNDKITTTKTADELEEIATEHAIECGAEELEIIDADTKHMTFISDPMEVERVKQKLAALGYNVEGAEHVFIPNNPITLSKAEQEAYENFKEKLKNFEGVDSIYDNVIIET